MRDQRKEDRCLHIAAFDDGYDVSSKGICKKELQEDISILEKSSNPEDVEVVKRLKFYLTHMDETITTRDFLRIGRALRRNGFEPVDRLGDHADGATKFTFRKAGSREYGQHEFMSIVMEDKAYCSYNYGNNFLTHFLIDYLGWKGRGGGINMRIAKTLLLGCSIDRVNGNLLRVCSQVY